MLVRFNMCVNHARRVCAERTLSFLPGLNVIAGPNGSGKSTLLKAIFSCPECERQLQGDRMFHYFNSETMNPRIADGPAGTMTNMTLRARAPFSSHGQIMKAALTSIAIRRGESLLIDEPESGQDLEGTLRLRNGFKAICAKGGQVIVASHHPAFCLWEDAHLIELEEGYAQYLRLAYRKII